MFEKENLIISIITNAEKNYEGDLVHYFKLLFNAPSSFNPYHNFRHPVYVCCMVYKAGIYEDLDKEQMLKLLIAALFHDIEHSGKMGNDKLQVAAAVNFTRKHIAPEHVHLLEDIILLIDATCFPHDDRNKAQHLEQLIDILRDADLSTILDENWLQHTVLGLAQEYGLTPNESLKRQIEFNSSVVYKSRYGREVLALEMPHKIEHLLMLKEILL